MKRKIISVFLFLVFVLQLPLLAVDSYSVTDMQLQDLAVEVQKIRTESALLKIALSASKAESAELKAAVKTLDKQLMQAEKKLKQAVQSSEISRAELIELKNEIKLLKTALQELKKRVQALNRRLAKLKRTNTILITVVCTLGAAVIGVGIYEGVKRR